MKQRDVTAINYIQIKRSGLLTLNLLDDSILHVDISQEGLIVIDYLCSFDEETVTLKGGDSI